MYDICTFLGNRVDEVFCISRRSGNTHSRSEWNGKGCMGMTNAAFITDIRVQLSADEDVHFPLSRP